MNTSKHSRSDAQGRQQMTKTLRRALFESMLRIGDGTADERKLTVPPAAQPIAPALLAAVHPEASRPAMCALYEVCLRHYRSEVGGGAGQPDDVRGAVARFVAANMQALQAIEITPSMIERLRSQLAVVTRLSSRWERAGLRERQLFFEKMAIVAVLIDQAWTRASTEGPAAIEHVRSGARTYLRELLGLEPDGLTLSESGLGLTPAAQAA
jgi:hypothetical protein